MKRSQRSEAERTAKTTAGATAFLVLFTLFWCGLTGAFDAVIIPAFVRQVQSTWYQPATATILESKLKHSDDTTGVSISYRYTVNGHEYTSDRFKFDSSSSSDSSWARDAVRDHPINSQRTCYYDPSNPSRAVLEPGIHGSDVFLLMFMTPFNMVGLGFLWALIFRRREDQYQPQPRVTDRFQNREAYLMSAWTPIGAFLATFGLATFLGIFVVVFPGGFHPSLAKVCAVWAAGLLASITVAMIAYQRNASGRYDLVLDHNARALTIPQMHRRASREMLPYASVSKIEARTVKTTSGDDEKTTYQVLLITKDGAEHLLKNEITETRATRLAETLSLKLGL